MKRISVALLLALACTGFAQDQRPTGQTSAMFSGSEKREAPSYSDIYCAGFVAREKVPVTNHIVGGAETPHATKFVAHETVYLAGSGYAVGNKYTVLRQVGDPNRYEYFPGERKLLTRSGAQYAELGNVVITRVEGTTAVARVEFSCQPMIPGDILVPFAEKEMVQYRKDSKQFEPFAEFSTGISGRIIAAKEFDQVLGYGYKVYVNIGANKGLKPGDYLRITRSYDPREMDPVDQLSLEPPSSDDTQRHAPKIPRKTLKKLPYRGLGEGLVISVTPETATLMITLALKEIQVGDVVEVPAK